MAFDFLSAPGILISPRFILVDRNLGTASSVDAERAFSGGRLQVNHLQHQTSSQAFKAPFALGSWIGTPLLPSSKKAAVIMENSKAFKRKGGKGKGKEKANEVVEISDESEMEVDK
ncbi:hypothetical protein B0H14DRAFT_2346078 [Mycena olivaceomarginata]|nr:hypothetical protein B0H14DRAFT_2346078 [Mycena olivaceomarginata]